MFGNIKLYALLGVICAVCVGFGLYQFKQASNARYSLEVLTDAAIAAEKTRKADLKADIQAAHKRASKLDSVRSSGILVEKEIAKSTPPSDADRTACGYTGDYLRLLNSSIDEANSAIESTRGVSR